MFGAGWLPARQPQVVPSRPRAAQRVLPGGQPRQRRPHPHPQHDRQRRRAPLPRLEQGDGAQGGNHQAVGQVRTNFSPHQDLAPEPQGGNRGDPGVREQRIQPALHRGLGPQEHPPDGAGDHGPRQLRREGDQERAQVQGEDGGRRVGLHLQVAE